MVTGGVGRGDTTSEANVGRHYLLAPECPDSGRGGAASGPLDPGLDDGGGRLAGGRAACTG